MTTHKKSVTYLGGLATAAFLATVAMGTSGCIEDADCGICDPDNLIVESFAGINYAGDKIHKVSPNCEGENCPEPFDQGSYFVTDIGPCIETEAAQNSPDPEEYCRLAPLMTASGLEVIFNNLLDPASIELVRRRPDNPQLFEVYDWKTRILELQGPTTRFNGDFAKTKGTRGRDLHSVNRLVNLACIDNLRDKGIPFTHEDYEDPENNPCNTIDPETGLPMKLRPEGTLTSYRGVWAPSIASNDCTSTGTGPDDCCTYCEWVLSTTIARYGVDEAEQPRNPNNGTALTCDPTGDPLVQCADFITQVDRSHEYLSWDYYWECDPAQPGCEPGTYRVPQFDRLRETHPDERPEWLVNETAPCSSTAECLAADGQDLPGTQCVGTNGDGQACTVGGADETCSAVGSCQPSWFVGCRADPDTTGGDPGYCVDTRFDPSGTAACFRATDQFQACSETGSCQTARANTPLTYCDQDANGILTGQECCQESLDPINAEDAVCDPFYQADVEPIARYHRSSTLPEQTRTCVCQEEPAEGCEDAVAFGCLDEEGNLIPERIGEYAVKFISIRGGVIYDPAIKGVLWLPADRGGIRRAQVERCAANALTGFPERNRHEGWNAYSEGIVPENPDENFDRAMCSGSEYTVVFQEPEEGQEYVRDKVGNTLAGKSRYTFETPQFHLDPGSGAPNESSNISACGTFSMRFSNRYDLSPENIRKLQIFHVDCPQGTNETCFPIAPSDACTDETRPVAGGPGCAETGDELALMRETDPCAAPCLTVDLSGQFRGSVEVWIDEVEFGAVLEQGERYWLLAPALGSIEEASNPELYRQAFWDACGMPLVMGNQIPYQYTFTIDPPSCRDDEDRDGVPGACDNAEEQYNPDQGDIDRDGFGDVIDLCPTIVATNGSNTGDSDKDGVGNACDNCQQAVKQYNSDAQNAGVPYKFLVRNIPYQDDVDQDGIGDVCDNCVVAANCESFGPDNPWELGESIAFNNENRCQRDDNSNMIGDACEGQTLGENAAGVVGFTETDDFDQDGLVNAEDICPRQPVSLFQTCTTDDDCPATRDCSPSGICNHRDSETDAQGNVIGDGVGDVCDTCPERANFMQTIMGGMEEDDLDGDFVGAACETDSACANVPDPRPFSFFPVESANACCTVQLIEDEATGDLLRVIDVDRDDGSVQSRPLLDPDGLPIRRGANCDEETQDDCRALPPEVETMPGVVNLPSGCEAALLEQYGEGDPIDLALRNLANRVVPNDVDDDLNALWDNLCFLPQFDQDFDRLGDGCDLCPRAFDPDNTPYTDENGRFWARNGRFCSGEYDPRIMCGGEDEETGTGGMETDGMGTGGMSGTGG